MLKALPNFYDDMDIPAESQSDALEARNECLSKITEG